MAHILPVFTKLWDNYPNSHDTAAVKKEIGGNVDAAWITNTCTIRLSRALNYAGSKVPAAFPGLNVVRGADKLFYAFRVKEMNKYMTAHFGASTHTSLGGADGRTAVAGKRGIIMFDVQGWNDATGHFDLWNGVGPRYSEYFDKAREVKLWVCPLRVSERCPSCRWCAPRSRGAPSRRRP